jgi:membrane protease YdiL (CAAX protease family)
LEVVLVAIGGYLVVPLFFALYGVTGAEITSNSRYLFLLLVSEATITLILVWSLLHLHGEGPRLLGWKYRNVSKEVRIGLLSVPLLFAATFLVGLFFRQFLPEQVTEENPILSLIQSRSDLLLFLVGSIYVGGFKEEVQRAFVLVRFESHLGGIGLGLILWSVFFAYGHLLQGADNAAGAGVLGLMFGLLYVWRRILVAPMIAHAAYDIATLLIYWEFVRNTT